MHATRGDSLLLVTSELYILVDLQEPQNHYMTYCTPYITYMQQPFTEQIYIVLVLVKQSMQRVSSFRGEQRESNVTLETCSSGSTEK